MAVPFIFKLYYLCSDPDVTLPVNVGGISRRIITQMSPRDIIVVYTRAADIDIINTSPDRRIAALYTKKEFNECKLCGRSNLQERNEF